MLIDKITLEFLSHRAFPMSDMKSLQSYLEIGSMKCSRMGEYSALSIKTMP